MKSSKEQDQAKSTKEIKEEIKDEPIDSPVDFKFISKKNSLDCKIENLPTNDVKLTETAPSFSEKYSQDSLIVDELLPEQILSTVKSELVVKSESTIATKETHKKSDKVTKKSSDKEVKPLVDDAMKKVENIEVKKESTEIKIEVPGKIEVKTTKVVKIEKKTELARELSKKSFKIPKKSSSANKKVVPSVDFRQVLENEEISTIIKPLAKRDRFKSRKDSESKAEIVKVAKTNDPPATMPKTKREPKKKPQVIKRPLYTDQEDLPPAKKLRQMESDVEFLKSFKVKVGDKKIPETKVQKVEMPQMEEKLSKSEIREIREITKIAEFKEPEVAQVLTDANNTDEILLSPIMTESFVNNNGMSDSFMENLNLSMTPKSFNINIAAQSSAKIKDSTINDSIEEEMKRIEAGHVNAVKISEDQPSSKEKCVKQEVEVGISEINNNSITAIPLFQKVELPDSTASPQSDRSKENVLQNANTSGDAPWIWNTKKSEYRREVEDGQTIFYVTRKKKNNKKKTG